MNPAEITAVSALEILDSRGNPTIEAEIRLAGGVMARASVPSGASTGRHEALELRDGDSMRYGGKGVLRAAEYARTELAAALVGSDVREQAAIDARLIAVDGTPDKIRCGANAILALSLAAARAAARVSKLPLRSYLGGVGAHILPVPMMNVINAGAHSDAPIDIQEFMIVPTGFSSFREALRGGSEIFHALGGLLRQRGLSAAVGDEGGYAPALRSATDALDCLMQAIERAGYRPGDQVQLALDVASSEFYNTATGRYELRKSSGESLTAAEMVELYAELCSRYPIVSIEDGCAEEDWEGWQLLTRRLGDRCRLVGDDLFVTNVNFLRRGIRSDTANALLVKPNQIGTLSETLEAVRMAQTHAYTAIISHRSGDTDDSFIADLAVATSAGFIKCGSLSRGERLAKYNRLLRIEAELGSAASYGLPPM